VNGLDLEEPNWSTGQLTAEESNANKSVTIFPWNCSLTAWHTLHLPGPEILANSLTAPLIVWANSIIGQRHWPTEAGAFLRKLFGSHLSDNSRKSPPIHWTSFLGSLLYRKVWRLVRSKKTLVGLLMDLAHSQERPELVCSRIHGILWAVAECHGAEKSFGKEMLRHV